MDSSPSKGKEKNKIFNNLEKYKKKTWHHGLLGNFLTLQRGFDLPKRKRVKGPIPIISSSGVTGKHNIAKVDGPGVVTGRYGTLGKVYYIENNFWPLNTTLFVKDFKGNNQRFISYFLKTLKLENLSSAAAVPGVDRNVLHKVSVQLPTNACQQKIAAILSAYDDLIENNTRRIKILEEMAQLIYREWFVNFRFPGHEKVTLVDSELGKIPEGWEVAKFKDKLKIYNGFAFKSRDYSDKGTLIIRTKDFASKTYVDIKDEIRLPKKLTRRYEQYKLKELDFLIVMVGASIGKYGIIYKKDLPALQNQNMWSIRAKDNSILSKFFICLAMPDIIYKVRSFATGAARSFFRKEHFYQQNILLPNISILKSFDSIVSPIIINIGFLLTKNANLRQTRDLLLPKLISGELDVSELDIKVKEETL